ncbi:MAG: 4Fe-4S binding protein [Syntrophorhabdaceae bacterium]|nr:4Fe-4S binding protein [Syntrophorhabdaceae bacterium]
MPKTKEQHVEKYEEWESSKVRIRIIPRYCKGCDICVKLCSVRALGMEMFKAKVLDVEKCNACMQCENHCPDFAIYVEKKEATL